MQFPRWIYLSLTFTLRRCLKWRFKLLSRPFVLVSFEGREAQPAVQLKGTEPDKSTWDALFDNLRVYVSISFSFSRRNHTIVYNNALLGTMTMRPDASEVVEQLRARNRKTTMRLVPAENIFLRRGVGPPDDPRESVRPYLARKAAKAPWRVHEVKNKQDSAEQEGREAQGGR